MRLLSGDELRGFAEAAGLTVELLAGDYGLGPMGPGTERAILIAVKAVDRPLVPRRHGTIGSLPHTTLVVSSRRCHRVTRRAC